MPGIQNEASITQVTSHELHDQILYFNTSLVHIAFLCLIDQVTVLLQYSDVKSLVTQCENVMACEQENIKLFSSAQIEKLKEFDTVLLMLNLSCLFTWSNHSILRMLLTEASDEAIKLLDKFDSKFDPLQSIISYPIPHFSLNMIPDDTSTYTILAIRCDQELYKTTLQYVYNMQSVMMAKCHITQHCFHLLAVNTYPTIIYWTIPKCVVALISNQVPQHSEYLYSIGVLEVLVYPEPLLNTGDHVSIGSLAFKAESENIEEADVRVGPLVFTESEDIYEEVHSYS